MFNLQKMAPILHQLRMRMTTTTMTVMMMRKITYRNPNATSMFLYCSVLITISEHMRGQKSKYRHKVPPIFLRQNHMQLTWHSWHSITYICFLKCSPSENTSSCAGAFHRPPQSAFPGDRGGLIYIFIYLFLQQLMFNLLFCLKQSRRQSPGRTWFQ